ncbi:hypothetical protein [Paenibacillus tundrae]|uniref:Uncharacterized protein n=1 Tax=Paenibacillus tundrae TaxID=528187 RepID=A0ABT9WIN3_9BACL|nr:hypothetical protein [Paenibacillus tundrae]MDQ0173082.1 hypothetical protein [Paenibacillus tundrae]
MTDAHKSLSDSQLEEQIKRKEDELRVLYRERYKRAQGHFKSHQRPYVNITDKSIRSSISASVANYFVYHIGNAGRAETLDCYAAASEYLAIPKYGDRYVDTEVTLNDITLHMRNLKQKWKEGWRG